MNKIRIATNKGIGKLFLVCYVYFAVGLVVADVIAHTVLKLD